MRLAANARVIERSGITTWARVSLPSISINLRMHPSPSSTGSSGVKAQRSVPAYSWLSSLVVLTSLYNLRRTMVDHRTEPHIMATLVTASHSMT